MEPEKGNIRLQEWQRETRTGLVVPEEATSTDICGFSPVQIEQVYVFFPSVKITDNISTFILPNMDIKIY